MAMKSIQINRAPVITLWATVVAERLGYAPDEALTLAKAVAGLNAQSKARRLGIVSETPQDDAPEKQRQRQEDASFAVEILSRPVPAVNTQDGIRALDKGKPVSPQSVQRYLEGKFGEALPEVRRAFEALADAYPPERLRTKAYPLYEEFRPAIPEGAKGWGAKGELDLDLIARLAKGEKE